MKITAALLSHPPVRAHPGFGYTQVLFSSSAILVVSFSTVLKYNLLVICWHVCLPCQSAYSARAEAVSIQCVDKYLVLSTMLEQRRY